MTPLIDYAALFICVVTTAAGLSAIAALFWAAAWIALGVIRTWEFMT